MEIVGRKDELVGIGAPSEKLFPSLLEGIGTFGSSEHGVLIVRVNWGSREKEESISRN